MARTNSKYIPDDMLDAEIERLWATEAVKLAKKEQQIIYRRRQQLYQLRYMEKRGLELMAQGVNLENIEDKLFGSEVEEYV